MIEKIEMHNFLVPPDRSSTSTGLQCLLLVQSMWHQVVQPADAHITKGSKVIVASPTALLIIEHRMGKPVSVAQLLWRHQRISQSDNSDTCKPRRRSLHCERTNSCRTTSRCSVRINCQLHWASHG